MEMEMKKEREGGDRGDRPMVSDEGPSGRTAKMKFTPFHVFHVPLSSSSHSLFLSFILSLFHSRSIRFDIFQEFV